MNDSPLFSLFGYFALLSLFAVGGANAAIPEMHRISVEVMQW
ncbi:MAG: chromate transporter, partial [Pseudolabrys sp.]